LTDYREALPKIFQSHQLPAVPQESGV
jgi:hypothetical protein